MHLELQSPLLLKDEVQQDNTLSGFEGPEKLLEIWFKSTTSLGALSKISKSQIMAQSCYEETQSSTDEECTEASDEGFLRQGLRRIDRDTWQDMLNTVRCQILSVLSNEHSDAYLLSESSLFVYPDRIILKTCGTTTLLNALPKIFDLAAKCGFHELEALFYSRKAYNFPEKQVYPHGRWDDEVAFLEEHFPKTKFDNSAYVLGKMNGDHWCLFMCTPLGDEESWSVASRTCHSPSSSPDLPLLDLNEEDVTLEILMTDLDPFVIRHFWRTPEEQAAAKLSSPNDTPPEYRVFQDVGIASIYPGSSVNDFVFDPCGYSLNGLLGPYYYTIHVTPEDHCSYASFETSVPVKRFAPSMDSGLHLEYDSFEDVIDRVVKCFQPGQFSVTLLTRQGMHSNRRDIQDRGLLRGSVEDYRCRDRVTQSLGKWDLTFGHFVGKSRGTPPGMMRS